MPEPVPENINTNSYRCRRRFGKLTANDRGNGSTKILTANDRGNGSTKILTTNDRGNDTGILMILTFVFEEKIYWCWTNIDMNDIGLKIPISS